MRRKAGFTLVELLMVMAIMGLVLAAISDMFIGLLGQYKQQGKISETNIEGIIGLEILRQDIERAGYGLPWVIPAGSDPYAEAAAAPASNYNDSPGNPPRAIVSGNDADFTNGVNSSDYLVIKATNIIRNDTAQRWTYVTAAGANVWQPLSAPENLQNTDFVIVLEPGATDAETRTLLSAGTTSTWIPTFGDVKDPSQNFMPADPQAPSRWVYGIYDKQPRMPFNRTDYYILGPNDTTAFPSRCAPNTGVLFKSMISQTSGAKSDVLPLLDCVASMQVVYRLDTNNDGAIDTSTDDISLLSAADIRNQVKEIRVYILAHEGQLDKNYNHPTSNIYVGDPALGGGKNFNVGAYVHYRWKLYTIVVQPKNMRQL